MNKTWIKVTVIVSLAVICGILVWRYQMRQLSNNLRSLRVDSAQTVTLGAAADLVLDRSVLQDLPSRQNKAVLEQLRDDPRAFDEKARFVTTWKRASSMIQAVSLVQMPLHQVITSTVLDQTSPDDRLDAWNNPFCVYSDGATIVVMSGGDSKAQIQCTALNVVAKELAAKITTAKLVKHKTGVYAVVQSRPKGT